MNPETRLKDDLMRKIKAAYPAAFFFRTGAGPFAAAGCPDILGCFYGRFVGIEVKAPGKYKDSFKAATPAQKRFGEKIKDAGGFWFVTDEVEHTMKMLSMLFDLLPNKV